MRIRFWPVLLAGPGGRLRAVALVITAFVYYNVENTPVEGAESVPAGEITVLLAKLAHESGEARKATYDHLVALVYDDLRRRARHQMHAESDWNSLQPTALVHEAYERLLGYEMEFENRAHFLNVASTAMRRVLVDRARKRKAEKRRPFQSSIPLESDDVVRTLVSAPDALLDLDAAVNTLRPEQIRLVELRYFAGLTIEETAAAMGLQPETVKKRWQVIKTLLYDKLRDRRGV
jgi:RNA polymerase sigma factor (TIGR02999 family)